jgi:protein tyrosine phosphatase type IVA
MNVKSISTKPSLVSVKNMNFLIMDAPREANLDSYIKEMVKNGVTALVRACEPTYRGHAELSSAGIDLYDMEYPDGTSPPTELIQRWLDLVDRVKPGCIAIHCVAGLGRAPVMVAIALIEFANMDPVDAVTLIRSKRRGAINEKQLLYLQAYKKQYKKKKSEKETAATCGCVIS